MSDEIKVGDRFRGPRSGKEYRVKEQDNDAVFVLEGGGDITRVGFIALTTEFERLPREPEVKVGDRFKLSNGNIVEVRELKPNGMIRCSMESLHYRPGDFAKMTRVEPEPEYKVGDRLRGKASGHTYRVDAIAGWDVTLYCFDDRRYFRRIIADLGLDYDRI